MSDSIEDLGRRLVIGHKRDGRSVYDPQAKQELVEACLQPGASVARLARQCGVNANQVATWVRLHERRAAAAAAASEVAPSPEVAKFVELKVSPAAPPAREAMSHLKLQARLPNGVMVDLSECDMQNAAELLQVLGRLRCSASTKG
jgi:transposase